MRLNLKSNSGGIEDSYIGILNPVHRMSSSPSPSSSSTLLSLGDSQAGQSETLPPRSCMSPSGEWTSSEIKFIFRDVKPDPMPCLVMMQMIADAYEERRRIWEFNKDRPQKGENPAMYGPINKAQKVGYIYLSTAQFEHFITYSQKVEDFLVEWRFLSGPSATDKLVMQEVVAHAKELIIIPLSKHRGHRTKKSLKSGLSAKTRYMFHKHLKIGKMPQARSIPKPMRRKVIPTIVTRRLRPALTALPRVDPGYEIKRLKQRTLRRMTKVDSSVLRACSIRKRKFTPTPEYRPTTEFLAELHPPPRRFIPTREPRIQHDNLKTLSWMKPQRRQQDCEPSMSSIGKKKVASIDHEKTHTSPFISFTIYLVIQLIILALCVVGVVVALWTVSSAILRSFQRCLFSPLGLPQQPEENASF
ncbi:hypothetical protein C0995_011112 [Termitomyces sp. Mi166|nr:hypothetical protein C0995_011112 [Termitomyces sp. Mi166\